MESGLAEKPGLEAGTEQALPERTTGVPRSSSPTRPHIVLIVPRGEAVRNFLYTETLPVLSGSARVTLLTVIEDEDFMARFEPWVDRIIHLPYYPDRRPVAVLKRLAHTAHYRWLWSATARNLWEIDDYEVTGARERLRRTVLKTLARLAAHRPVLEALTRLEQSLSWHLRPNDDLADLFRELEPDLVFNCSHIHGLAGELPVKVAHRLGIPTAGFIFSWDNLTSRSRIFVPYDDYLVWNASQAELLRSIYPFIAGDRVWTTGTPQFDFHFSPDYQLSREALCREIGIDPSRPFVLYTTGIHTHFPEEHRTVELVARSLSELDPRPQLVVRTYVKGTSPEMIALRDRGLDDVVFPQVAWEEKWFTPLPEDLPVYTSLLRHASLGINAASTVSLELLMLDKPVINLGFDPPGSRLPHCRRFERHLDFDHYRPVVESGAVRAARSPEDLQRHLREALADPSEGTAERGAFIRRMFADTLDGGSGRRVAKRLLALARKHRQ